MNNARQLMLAWNMYAGDNNDACVNNYTTPQTALDIAQFATTGTYHTWCVNKMDWSPSSVNTNTSYLQLGLLGPYMAKNTSAYKCPADNFLHSSQRNMGFTKRTRSYSMNSCFGIDSSTPDQSYTGRNPLNLSFLQFLKVSSIRNPSQFFVFVEEHPDSINDGWFDVGTIPTYTWVDIPSSLHAGAGCFAFVDGHSEIHKWHLPIASIPVLLRPQQNYPAGPNHDDIIWMWQHATCRPNGSLPP